MEKLIPWSERIKGARDLLVRLRDCGLCDEPKPKGYAKGKDDKIYNKAILDLILYDQIATDKFLNQDYDYISFFDHERNKKGKLIKCKARFV